MSKYDYLKKYKNSNSSFLVYPCNFFEDIENVQNEIKEIEFKFNIDLPKSLKEFWLNIGHGSLLRNHEGFGISLSNYVLPPQSVARALLYPKDCVKSRLILGEEELELIDEGYFPFFEVADNKDFFYMKPGEESVYDIYGRMLEETFEEFLYNLYYINPIYYDIYYEGGAEDLYSKLLQEWRNNRQFIIQEWEVNTEKEWPKYNSYSYIDGKAIKIATLYNAHHIIPMNHGGPNKWWNIAPASIDQQIEINKVGSAPHQIFVEEVNKE